MRIGEIAKLTGLNISNIRFYERKGLFLFLEQFLYDWLCVHK